jgi:hypothetical protein
MPDHPPPPRGVEACIESLTKRRDWVADRAGGSYDERERIACSYAIGLLMAAKRLNLVEDLEDLALDNGWIEERWVEELRMERRTERRDMKCDRCGSLTSAYTTSYFNTDTICLDCQEKEAAHPLYDHAKRIELEAVQSGNYNFPGIGLPADLR